MKRSAFLPGRTAEEWISWARRYDDAGFDSLWQGELANVALIPLAAVAPATKRIALGTGVSLAFTHSPVMLAFAALDLDVASQGRFRLGLGVAHPNRNNNWYAGRDDGKPVSQMREYVEVARLAMDVSQRGGDLSYEGKHYHLRARSYFTRPPGPRPRVPIYLAAVKGGMSALAGEVADGLIGNPLFTPRHVREVILPGLEKGLARAGRTRSDIEVLGQCFTVIDADLRHAYEVAARAILFSIWARIYDELFSAHGYTDVLTRVREAQKGGAGVEAAKLVPDEMVDEFCAVGDADRVRERVAQREGLLDTVILAVPSTGLGAEEQGVYRERILEVFAS